MKTLTTRVLPVVFACLAALGGEPARAKLAVENHSSGSTVRYPVILIRGTVTGSGRDLRIKHASRVRSGPMPRPVVRGGRFKLLVPLAEGKNVLEFHQPESQESVKLTVTYKRQTNPYYVRLIWLTDKSGDTSFAAPNDRVPQDYAARLRTAAVLMQTLTAERMQDIGFGRRTFRLERDPKGEVVVHTWKAPESREYYYALGDSGRYWQAVYRWVNRTHPDRYAKNIVLAAFTRKDKATGKMRGHTALGGGNLGLFGSASVFSWPCDVASATDVFHDARPVDASQVHDDSAGRGTYWSVASTTIGAVLHEMGHTFGLPHCRDQRGIMTRGFDHLNRVFTLRAPPSKRRGVYDFPPREEAYFAPVSASYLQWSRWFRLDERPDRSDAPPRIELDDKSVTFHSTAGVPWVGLWVGPDIYAHREFSRTHPPQKVRLSFQEIAKQLNGRPLSRVTMIDANGRARGRRVPKNE